MSLRRRLSVGALLCVLCLLFFAASCQNGANDTETKTIEELSPEEQIIVKNSSPLKKYFMSNPLGVTGIGDPMILYDNGAYYLYATSIGVGFKAWKSTNASSWTSIGNVFQKSSTTFGEINYWAPEVYKHNGRYYLFYSALHKVGGKNRYAIGCAASDSPEGPFTDIMPGKPIYAPDYSVIDANVLFDKSGKIYLYYSKDCSENIVNGKHVSQIYGVELAKDFKSVIGEPVLISTPDASWETSTGNTMWNEGPCVFERNGVYYLLYSGGFYGNNSYSVGCAVSDSPLGTYKKYKTNPVLKGDGTYVSGSGHNNYFFSPDGTEMYAVYHSHTNPAEGGGDRQLCIDRILFDDKNQLSVNGPTFFSIPIPSGTAGVQTVARDRFALSVPDGVKTVRGSTDKATNGIIKANVGRVSGDCWIVEPGQNGIGIRFTEPMDLNYIALYGDPNHTSRPESVTLVINGRYRIEDVPFSDSYEPTLFSFRNLPEGETVSSLTFCFRFDGQNDSVAIKEIVPVANLS